MASGRQRAGAQLRKGANQELQSEDSLFSDIGVDIKEDDTEDRRDLFNSKTKNRILMMLLLNEPQFPMEAGQKLIANPRDPKFREYMTILADGQIETKDGIKPSLDAAEKVYHKPNRKAGAKASGWEKLHVPTVGSKSIPLTELVGNNFDKLGVDPEIASDEHELAKYLLKRGWVSPAYRDDIERAAKPKVKSESSLDSKSSHKKPATSQNSQQIDGSI